MMQAHMQHQGLASGTWFAMNIAEQLGNVGSEVGRAGSWRRRANAEQSERAFVRALELLDLTLADARWSVSRKREVARVREALCESFSADALAADADSWDRYFTPFAVAARSGR
jgi:hypothetical protein